MREWVDEHEFPTLLRNTIVSMGISEQELIKAIKSGEKLHHIGKASERFLRKYYRFYQPEPTVFLPYGHYSKSDLYKILDRLNKQEADIDE